MKYKIPYIIMGILILLLMYFSVFCKPNINFSTEINNISEEDYQRIVDSKQVTLEENETINNFKHLSINVKIKSPYGFVKNIKISTPQLSEYLEQSNVVVLSDGWIDAYKERTENVYIYLNNTDKKSLMNRLKDFKYIITWANIWNKTDKEIFYFNDYLK